MPDPTWRMVSRASSGPCEPGRMPYRKACATACRQQGQVGGRSCTQPAGDRMGFDDAAQGSRIDRQVAEDIACPTVGPRHRRAVHRRVGAARFRGLAVMTSRSQSLGARMRRNRGNSALVPPSHRRERTAIPLTTGLASGRRHRSGRASTASISAVARWSAHRMGAAAAWRLHRWRQVRVPGPKGRCRRTSPPVPLAAGPRTAATVCAHQSAGDVSA